MKVHNILRVIAVAVVTCTFALVLSTCGGHQRVAPPFQPVTDASLDDALTELDAYPCPDGVDAELFAELKDALAAGLTTNNQKPTTARFACAPPAGDENRVTDLAITDNGGGNYTLSWHYRNLGDYDQNGTVGISDITPIAMHYSETYDREMEPDCLLAVIDGSANSVIEIADITPIAMNYGVSCAGYRVQGQTAPGSWTDIYSVQFSLSHTEAGRLQFSYDLGAPARDFYRVVPYDASGLEGIRSTVAPETASQPPNILGLSPHGGISGESVVFSAIVEGSEPLSYAWDFGGGATPNTSSEASPTVVLSTPDAYSAFITAANPLGEDTYQFTLTVAQIAVYRVSGHVEKDTGGGLRDVTLTLTPGGHSATTDSSGDYAITDVPNGNYTLTPGLSGWSFEPPALSITVNNGNVSGKNFTALDEGPDEWHITVVDSDYDTGWCASLAIVNGNPAMSYYIGSDINDLKYVRATDARGSSWGIPVTVDSAGIAGWYTSLAVVNGNPAIAYYYSGNGYGTDDTALRYARAYDANGAAWDNPVTVDSPVLMDYYSNSLAVVNGNPAIAYYDADNRNLKYVRAKDAEGDSWEIPIIVDGSGDVGGYAFLTVVSGNPTISYYDQTNDSLKYVRADDADGSLWGTPVTVDGTTHSAHFTCMAVVNGNPAISYYDGANYDLKYVRASDADGSAWASPVTLDSAGDVGAHNSIAVVNGNPAISYSDNTNNALKYVQASDGNGSAWESPVTIDTVEWVGCWCVTLAVIDGNPAIGYYGNADLKFAAYY